MNKVALITGGAKRIGAVIVKKLHKDGFNVAVHCHSSLKEAEILITELNQERAHSATSVVGDIREITACKEIVEQVYQAWQRLDVLVNNASSFYPTPVAKVNEAIWQDLFGSNLKGPFFLSQSAERHLQNAEGVIINIVDIHADRPLKNYPIYSMAKAGLVMLTKSLAREFAPKVRVNAVAPGVILWPEAESTLSPEVQQRVIARTCLKRKGSPNDIAETVSFLIQQSYITGQIIAVDGGRSIKD